jgi:uncharacterized circularly permuted ATP-grasp superfamily protein
MSLEKQTLAMSPDSTLAASRSRSMKSPDTVIPPAVGFDAYDVGDFYDEMFDGDRQPRAHYRALYDRFWQLRTDELERRQMAAERSMRRLGITFSVYGDQEGSERIIPFDICPRIIPEAEWKWLERGLKQRIIALNKFIDDIYHKQLIVRDGVIPEFVVRSCATLRQQCMGLDPPMGIWCHITGIAKVSSTFLRTTSAVPRACRTSCRIGN